MAGTIWTVGHSNKPVAGLIDLLKANAIGVLVDVRTRPYSRFNPQFNTKALEQSITDAEMGYEWRGKNLGGLEGNVLYHETLDEYTSRAEAGVRVAVMCSEGSHLQCHRYSMLTPQFIRRGLEVVHIEWPKSATAAARKSGPVFKPSDPNGAVTMFEITDPGQRLRPLLGIYSGLH
jgi:uncharacterized protein (DUF488 family)